MTSECLHPSSSEAPGAFVARFDRLARSDGPAGEREPGLLLDLPLKTELKTCSRFAPTDVGE
jgi:hypothetical protein